MTINNIQRALLYLLATLLACATCIYLITIEILHPVAFIFVLFGCYHWCTFIWDEFNIQRRRPTRILKKLLPKCGFTIEKTEWNEEHTRMRIFGVFQDDHFIIEAYPESFHIIICDLPWHSVKSTDPSMRIYLEAINETNAENPNSSVVMCDPDENDMRDI